ncbi:hypothetical protein LPJ60_000228 [Coemansia sp. RSA 2675]|nr:hypothetical protein LPJ60_000228 [Coemansia sp. RSA 2675]
MAGLESSSHLAPLALPEGVQTAFRRRSIYESSEDEEEGSSLSFPERSLTGSLTASDDGLEEKRHLEYNLPPDGGYGWVVVACSFLLEFFAEGPISAFGVFQEYYVNERFKGHASNATISLVGVLNGSCMAILGVVSGKLCERYGYRPWHLLLTQGVLCGVGTALTFMPALVVPAQWFDRRRGLATGIVNMGIGVGGIVWTQFNHMLIRKISVAWTLRLTSVVVLVACTLSLMLIKTHQTTLAPQKVGWQALNDRRLVLFMAGSFFTGVSSLVPFYYLPGYARDIGVSESGGALIASMANAASLTGRLVATSVSDYFGPIVILLCAYFLTSTGILLVWTIARGYAGVDALPVLVGLYYTLAGVGYLFGPPVAGVILEKTKSWGPPYLALKLYTGVPMVIACIAIILLKLSTKKRLTT